MDQFPGGGNWSMIPNVQSHGSFSTPTNHDHLFLQQQQQSHFHHQQQQFQPQQQQQEMQFQQFQQQQQFIQQQQFHQQRLLQSPPQPQQPSLQSPPSSQTVVHTPQSMMHTPQQQQQQLVHTPQQSAHTPQQHQSLASHFHLYPLVEKLADAIENGTRDQNSDALVCLLITTSTGIGSKYCISSPELEQLKIIYSLVEIRLGFSPCLDAYVFSSLRN